MSILLYFGLIFLSYILISWIVCVILMINDRSFEDISKLECFVGVILALICGWLALPSWLIVKKIDKK